MKRKKLSNEMLIEYIINGSDNFSPEEREILQARYIEICKLVPTEDLHRQINYLGGFEKALNNMKIQKQLSNLFKVSISIIYIRTVDIYLRFLKEREYQKTKKKID